MLTIFFVPLWTVKTTSGLEMAVLSGSGIYTEDRTTQELVVMELSPIQHWTTLAMTMLAGMTAGFLLYVIFQYKKRLVQVKLAQIALILSVLTMGTMVLAVNAHLEKDVLKGAIVESAFQWGFFLPVLALIFVWLAARFIMKDEQLVRSMDRLR